MAAGAAHVAVERDRGVERKVAGSLARVVGGEDYAGLDSHHDPSLGAYGMQAKTDGRCGAILAVGVNDGVEEGALPDRLQHGFECGSIRCGSLKHPQAPSFHLLCRVSEDGCPAPTALDNMERGL